MSNKVRRFCVDLLIDEERMPNVIIREYKTADRERLRHISLATAMMGRPSNFFFDGDEILADALTIYYTDYEPDSSFVAEVDGEVVGYVISAKDTHFMDKVFASKIFWPFLWKGIGQGVFGKFKNWRLFRRILVLALKGGFVIPDSYAEYPATLHINVMDGHRALGLGGRLIQRCLQHLRECGVKGVRLATMSDQAGVFFEKNGFRLLYTSTRPYFYDILQKDVPFKIYARKID